MTKLSPREKILAVATGGVVFVLLNVLLLSAFARKNVALRADLSQGRSELAMMRQLMDEQGLWEKRNAWLNEKQPKLLNEGAAGVELLDLVRTIATKTNMVVENPSIGATEKTASARSVAVTLDTHSTWPDLVKFLQTIQQPDQFIVFENAHIQVDAGDPAKMQAHLKIARWYAL